MLKNYLEPVIWTIALAWLFFLDPASQGYSFCLFRLLGFDSCFGCGIGHAIHYALHLDFKNSFNEHILGLPATLVLISVIVKPLLSLKKPFKLT